MTEPGDEGTLEVLTRRIDLLRRLCDAPAYKRDLVDELEQSRSTISRSVRELEDLDLVERGEEGLAATMAGRLAVDLLTSFHDGLDDVTAAQQVLEPLPADAPVTTDAVAGSEAVLAADPAPYRPLERVHDALADAERYRAVLPALDDPRHVRLLYEHVVTDGLPADLVVTPEAFESLREEFPRRMAAMADEDGFRVLVADDLPPFLVAVTERQGDDPDPTVATVVFTDSGAVHGVLVNDADGAARWAEDLFADARAGATDRTDELGADESDGRRARQGSGPAPLGRSLPVSLERAGFVRLDRGFFRDEPVADPTTAWRAGLSVPEVHTGYAAERTVTSDDVDGAGSPDEDGAGTAAAGSSLTHSLVEALSGGSDTVLVGPPGSGKSTVCKRVACEWYDADRGPVLYRESGRGRPFEAVEDVVSTVEAADGDVLVVVEDAVRPEARAVFEVRNRLDDRGDVSFLFDARESEWADPAGEFQRPADLQVEAMPSLDETDVQRLVDHFERTVGTAVDVPVEQLWDGVREETSGEDVAHSGVVLLLHRLATYADPLTDERTSLEAAAAACYENLPDDDLALAVCTLANALNAAGLGVGRDALYAVADPDEFGRVDAAIERLEGRVLFPRSDGTYRTVHESWSVAFLDHLRDAESEDRASDLFGGALTDLLALTGDRDHREAIATHLGERDELAVIDVDPGEWVAGTVEALYSLVRKQPKLAPLFGDGATDSVILPAATPASVVQRRPSWLGRALLDGGYYDRAQRAYDRLSSETLDLAVERLRGLSRVAREQGDYDEAADLAEECRSLVGDADRPALRARADHQLGAAEMHRGDHESARAHLRSALEGFRAAGERVRVAETLRTLGDVARDQGDYESAADYHRRSLDVFDSVGDRHRTAHGLLSLGSVVVSMGDLDRARECFERSLGVFRDVGDRTGATIAYNNIALVAERRGNLDRAEEYYQQGLAAARELGLRADESMLLGNLSVLEQSRGNFGRSREYAREGVAIAREVGKPYTEAVRLNNLGLAAVRQGDHDRAREAFGEARAVAERDGFSLREANARNGLGHVARMEGRYDAAREHHETALGITREIDDPQRQADSHNHLGLSALRLGSLDRASEHFGTALDLARDLDDPYQETRALTGLASVARREGDYDRAGERVAAAEAVVDSLGGGSLVCYVRVAAGRLALARDDVADAREQTRALRSWAEDAGAPHWAARSRRLLGRVAAAEGDRETAREHLTAALDTFEELGAPGDALATLESLVEVCADAGDDEAVERWRERAAEVASGAPEAAVEVHADWLDAATRAETRD